MSLTNNQVFFTIHPAIEYVYALNFIANEALLSKLYADYGFSPADDFKRSVIAIKDKLSHFIQNELQYFFEWGDLKNTLGSILLENEAVKSVTNLIALIEQMDEKRLLCYIVKQALYGMEGNDEGDVDHLKQLILDADHKSEEDKVKLLEYVDNPAEIKSRLCLLLKQFYEKCYQPLEDKILIELSCAKEKYEKLFCDNPDYFNNEYLGKLLDSEYVSLRIHISYFVQIRAWTFDITPLNKEQFICFGLHTENYPRKKFIKAKVQKFVKILSDKNRFELIELLSNRPYYVHELSTELKLTSPTVCYHLNSMLDLNLVSLARGNNKTFYSLNKATIKELLDNAAEILL